MREKKTVFKLFFVWDFEKEERWLNEMAQEGHHDHQDERIDELFQPKIICVDCVSRHGREINGNQCA